MATFYVPRPPEDDPWQGKSARSYLIFAQLPPFPQKFWRYNYDDAAFWAGGATNPRIPPVRMPVGGGYPFLPRFWKFNYDDASFWTGSPNLAIPPATMPLNGGIPIKPPYWKYHHDDPGFWVGARTVTVFVPNLSSNFITTTDNMPLPINCVMIGDQVGSLLSPVEWKKPTFTVKTNNKGYE